ncbi:MAG: methionine synthase [Halioglobus sp.]
MSDPQDVERNADGAADAIAATAIISIVIVALYFWLSGMPS